MLVLEPEGLEIVDAIGVPEASIARTSAAGDDVYVVGVRAVHRFGWDRARGRLQRDESWRPVYRRVDGATVQSALFPAPGWSRDVYYCSFATLARIAVEA